MGQNRGTVVWEVMSLKKSLHYLTNVYHFVKRVNFVHKWTVMFYGVHLSYIKKNHKIIQLRYNLTIVNLIKLLKIFRITAACVLSNCPCNTLGTVLCA